MKAWLIALLLTCCSLHAGATSPEDRIDIGATAAGLLRKLDESCKQAPSPSALAASASPAGQADAAPARDLSCTCGHEAMDVAYPAATRTGSTTAGAFLMRFGGALNVCVARSVRRLVDTPCIHGVDPFARGSASPPAVAQARCQCARQELDKVASGDPLKDADAASARYAAGAPVPDDPPFVAMMKAVEETCAKVEPKKQ